MKPTSEPTTSASGPDYVPQVGDRVMVIRNDHNLMPDVGTLTTVVRVDSQGDVWLKDSGCCCPECLELTTKSFTPAFKVGDKVKIVKEVSGIIPNWVSGMDRHVGETSTIITVTDGGGAILEGVDFCYPLSSLELAKSFTPAPDKSYAENQAAWVSYHGLKVGDKVRVAKKFKAGEDGYTKSSWGSHKDHKYLGNVFEVKAICDFYITVDASWFPYFCLEVVK